MTVPTTHPIAPRTDIGATSSLACTGAGRFSADALIARRRSAIGPSEQAVRALDRAARASPRTHLHAVDIALRTTTRRTTP